MYWINLYELFKDKQSVSILSFVGLCPFVVLVFKLFEISSMDNEFGSIQMVLISVFQVSSAGFIF